MIVISLFGNAVYNDFIEDITLENYRRIDEVLIAIDLFLCLQL